MRVHGFRRCFARVGQGWKRLGHQFSHPLTRIQTFIAGDFIQILSIPPRTVGRVDCALKRLKHTCGIGEAAITFSPRAGRQHDGRRGRQLILEQILNDEQLNFFRQPCQLLIDPRPGISTDDPGRAEFTLAGLFEELLER